MIRCPVFALSMCAVLATGLGCSSSDGTNYDGSFAELENVANPAPDSNVLDDQPEPIPAEDPTTNFEPILPQLDSSNYIAVLKAVIGVINLKEHNRLGQNPVRNSSEFSTAGFNIINGDAPINGLVVNSITENPPSSGLPKSYVLDFTCVNNGQMRQTLYDFSNGPFSQQEIQYDECEINDVVYHGEHFSTIGRRQDAIDRFTNYRETSADNRIAFSGIYTRVHSFLDAQEDIRWQAGLLQNAGSDVVIKDFNWRRNSIESWVAGNYNGYVVDKEGEVQYVEEITYLSELEASFTMQGKDTNGIELAVTVTLNFAGNHYAWASPLAEREYPSYPVSDLGATISLYDNESFSATQTMVEQKPRPDRSQWQTGKLLITAPDGSQIDFRPHPSNPDLITVELNASGNRAPLAVRFGYQIDCATIVDRC